MDSGLSFEGVEERPAGGSELLSKGEVDMSFNQIHPSRRAPPNFEVLSLPDCKS